MSEAYLSVILYGKHVADLHQTRHGSWTLDYRDDHGTTPLSTSMPFETSHYTQATVEPFLDGLLPDNANVREQLGRQFDVSPHNPFALLSQIGLDCAGAVQFCAPGAVADVLSRRGALHRIDRDEIGRRLHDLVADPSSEWNRYDEHWSLAGAQSKIALHRQNDSWFETTGAIPTTHIIKPGITDFTFQALNEHICLSVARACGLPASHTTYETFGGTPAIVVTRYDRQLAGDGTVRRVHQEDMCQALSVLPRRKYEVNGGPTALAILRRIQSVAGEEDAYDCINALAFNSLIGAPDAHAKNYSLLLAGSRVRLAPLYDVASILPYDVDSTSALGGVAMAINGKRQFGSIGVRDWVALSRRAGLDSDRVVTQVERLASILPDAVSTIRKGDDVPPTASAMTERLQAGVQWTCSSITL